MPGALIPWALVLALFDLADLESQARSADRAFSSGLRFLEEGNPEWRNRFRVAFAEYRTALDKPGHALGAAFFHNLGNLALLNDELPHAILAYQRGLALDPNDQGMRHNLEYVRAKVSYPFGQAGRPPADAWPPWLYRPSPFQVLVLAAILYMLACVLGTRWLMTRRRKTFLRAFMAFILAVVLGSFWLYLEHQIDEHARYPLVVIRDDRTPLRKGNGPSYASHPDLPLLSRGMEARRLHTRGGWLQVQFATGEIGWVEESAALVSTEGILRL